MESSRGVPILLVEDNVDHAELTLRALRDGNVLNEVFWVKDGEEAVDFLHQRGRWGNGTRAPKPGLVLLDLKLPKLDGHGVLRHIKGDPELRTIPVVMLTTSTREDEITESYLAGANSFVSKPVQFVEFVDKVRTVKLYWVLTNIPTER